MSRLTAEKETRWSPSPIEERQRWPALTHQTEVAGPPVGLMITGLVVVGLGALAWYYFGSDLKRYLKIRNM